MLLHSLWTVQFERSVRRSPRAQSRPIHMRQMTGQNLQSRNGGKTSPASSSSPHGTVQEFPHRKQKKPWTCWATALNKKAVGKPACGLPTALCYSASVRTGRPPRVDVIVITAKGLQESDPAPHELTCPLCQTILSSPDPIDDSHLNCQGRNRPVWTVQRVPRTHSPSLLESHGKSLVTVFHFVVEITISWSAWVVE